MRMWLHVCTVFLAIACLSSSVWAGGLWLYEIGNPGVGTAGAGWAAAAQDASTAFTNPAGMTRLKRSELVLGFEYLLPKIEFNAGTTTTTTGTSGGNAGVPLPASGTFYVYNLSPK